MKNERYTPAEIPTMYFIGVTTAKSSIMKVFPLWMDHLGLKETVLRGMDFVPHDDPDAYRAAVEFIKNDSLSLGALVTTHKLDLLDACRDMFDELGPYARQMGEISSISKRGTKLRGHAKDPITSGLALEHFLPADHWKKTHADVMLLGAGGSSLALTSYLVRSDHGDNKPRRIVVTNRSARRIEEMKAIHQKMDFEVPIEYFQGISPEESDELVAALPPGSLIINATGLGKDAPGSPLSDAVSFPENAFVWDFNYRGDLTFLDQARRQATEKAITIEDGWVYFVHGWTRVIAEVFDLDIPTSGPEFERLSEIAATTRK